MLHCIMEKCAVVTGLWPAASAAAPWANGLSNCMRLFGCRGSSACPLLSGGTALISLFPHSLLQHPPYASPPTPTRIIPTTPHPITPTPHRRDIVLELLAEKEQLKRSDIIEAAKQKGIQVCCDFVVAWARTTEKGLFHIWPGAAVRRKHARGGARSALVAARPRATGVQYREVVSTLIGPAALRPTHSHKHLPPAWRQPLCLCACLNPPLLGPAPIFDPAPTS